GEVDLLVHAPAALANIAKACCAPDIMSASPSGVTSSPSSCSRKVRHSGRPPPRRKKLVAAAICGSPPPPPPPPSPPAPLATSRSRYLAPRREPSSTYTVPHICWRLTTVIGGKGLAVPPMQTRSD